MARVVKEDEFIIRRNEILDAAQQFIYVKGYEHMAIQDILDVLHISKGAFYHYFTSKTALLEALIERLGQESQALILPIVQDPGLSALEKLRRLFDNIARWKTAQKDYLMAILRVWYADDNAIVRQKMVSYGLKSFMPLLSEIVAQGDREGVMDAPYSQQIGLVLMSLMVGLGDATASLLLKLEKNGSPEENEACYAEMVSIVQSFTLAIERVLGARTGSVVLFDPALLKEWVVMPIDDEKEREGF
jgi:AcrR family transcriptional regulator